MMRSEASRPDLPAVERALRQPMFRLRFHAALEGDYEQITQGGRAQSLRFQLLIGALLQVLLLVTSALVQPAKFFYLALPPGLAVVAACLAGAGLQRARIPIWLQGAASVIAVVLFSAAQTYKGMFAPAPFGDRILTMFGLMGPAVVVVMPLRFRHAAVCSLLALTVHEAIVFSGIGNPVPGAIVTAWVNAIMTAVSLVLAWRHERSSRQAFLLGLQSQLLNDELSRLTRTDPLTGIANRRMFDEALAGACKALSPVPVGLIMVDVDHFKQYNDLLGHAEGDRCLHRVAQCLRDGVRGQKDVVARYGGEEFAVVLPNTLPRDALMVAERLRSRVEAMQVPHPRGGIVTCSVGVAALRIGEPHVAADGLVKAADAALYRAKQAGRNRVMQAEAPAPALAAD